MNKPSRVRMRGPLVAYRRGFTAELRRQGYSPFTAVSVLQLTTHLSRWLERQGLDAEDLTAIGAHRLRHSAASALRRAGVPLAQISEVLRHRYQATTARYVHEEPEALLVVARDWPGGDA